MQAPARLPPSWPSISTCAPADRFRSTACWMCGEVASPRLLRRPSRARSRTRPISGQPRGHRERRGRGLVLHRGQGDCFWQRGGAARRKRWNPGCRARALPEGGLAVAAEKRRDERSTARRLSCGPDGRQALPNLAGQSPTIWPIRSMIATQRGSFPIARGALPPCPSGPRIPQRRARSAWPRRRNAREASHDRRWPAAPASDRCRAGRRRVR